MRRFPLLIAMVWLFAAPLFAQSVSVAETYPLKGEPTTITVETADGPASGAVVVVVYRPNSQTGSTETLAPTDSNGQVLWTPYDAGIVTLTARADTAEGETIATTNLSVRFGSFPGSGLLIMILAGVLLFGGASLGFVMLFGEGQIPAEDPPST